MQKVRLNKNYKEFFDAVKGKLWDDRTSLGYPYRGVPGCQFFAEIYGPWVERGYISQRDLRGWDESLERKIRKEMSAGHPRPEGLVTENEAQLLDIKDEFERAVERRVRGRFATNQKAYRARKKAGDNTPKDLS